MVVAVVVLVVVVVVEDEVEVEVEVELELEVEVEVALPESGTCVLGAGVPCQVEEPHPVKLIVPKARIMKKNCRSVFAVEGEKRTQPPSQYL